MTRPATVALLAAALAACGESRSPACVELDPDRPPARLSALCLLDPSPGAVAPRPGMIPYDLNTPLFSDYAQKTRAIRLPAGAQVPYSAAGALELPVGTVVAKTFAIAPDQRAPAVGRRLIETRLLVRTPAGWRGLAYLWDADEQDATYTPGPRRLSIPMITPSGASVTASYLVPGITQCARCHADDPDGPLRLLGPTAANLNRDHEYPEGAQNQLARWAADGHLTGAPPPEAAPRLARAYDEAAGGTVAERARAWLEVNCAFCHSATGMARTTGLHLGLDVTDPLVLGVCKKPVAAGSGAGGRIYDLVPGEPDASILVHRLEATDALTVMPQIGRSVADEAAVALIRSWVEGLEGGPCP